MVGAVKILGPLCKNRHRYRGTFKSLRYLSTRQCIECHKNWVKARSKLPHIVEMLRKAARDRYWKNRAESLAKMSKYQKTDQFKEAMKRHRRKYRESRNAGTRRWKEQNKEHVAEYNRRYAQTV